jgi:hypothetical protein
LQQLLVGDKPNIRLLRNGLDKVQDSICHTGRIGKSVIFSQVGCVFILDEKIE